MTHPNTRGAYFESLGRGQNYWEKLVACNQFKIQCHLLLGCGSAASECSNVFISTKILSKIFLTENWVFIRFILRFLSYWLIFLFNLHVSVILFQLIHFHVIMYLMRRNLLHFAKTEFSNCLRLVNLTRKHTIQNGGHLRISFSTGKLFPFVRLCNHRDSHNLNTRMF